MLLSVNLPTYSLLVLTNEVFNNIVKEAKQAYPNEACGVMEGVFKDKKVIVSCTCRSFNISVEEGKFWFNELDWIQKVMSLMSNGLDWTIP